MNVILTHLHILTYFLLFQTKSDQRPSTDLQRVSCSVRPWWKWTIFPLFLYSFLSHFLSTFFFAPSSVKDIISPEETCHRIFQNQNKLHTLLRVKSAQTDGDTFGIRGSVNQQTFTTLVVSSETSGCLGLYNEFSPLAPVPS